MNKDGNGKAEEQAEVAAPQPGSVTQRLTASSLQAMERKAARMDTEHRDELIMGLDADLIENEQLTKKLTAADKKLTGLRTKLNKSQANEEAVQKQLATCQTTFNALGDFKASTEAQIADDIQSSSPARIEAAKNDPERKGNHIQKNNDLNELVVSLRGEVAQFEKDTAILEKLS